MTEFKYHLEALAEEGYKAYGQTTNFKNYQGLPMPEWDALPEKIKKAWVFASAQIVVTASKSASILDAAEATIASLHEKDDSPGDL